MTAAVSRFHRRRALAGGAALLSSALSSSALSSSALSSSTMGTVPWTASRLLPLRHTSVLAEVEDGAGFKRRVLFDPSLQPSFSMPGLFVAPPSPVREEGLGEVDLVCVSSSEPTSFDPRTLALLDTRRASVLVPDDTTAKRVRHLGLRRVRVVRAGDVVEVADLIVRVSPGRGAVANAVGFHVEPRGGGASLWHTGLLPPLEVDASVASFATAHRADVVLGCAWGLRLRAGGPPILADVLDATTVARLAQARLLVPLGTEARPAGVFSFVWDSAASLPPGPVSPPPSSSSSSPAASPGGLTVRALQPGAWHRVRPA